ncbi:MAG TPA: ABC transporter permease [Dermatophilaceae bacterium]|jgi:ABC-2 type transport system permease protein
MSAASQVRLTGLHARYQFTETIRVPIAVIGTMLFPSLSLLFFVVPQPFAKDPAAATTATAQLAVFAVMSVCLFNYGVGVAEDRALPWDSYLRTLPVGPSPRLIGRLVNGLAFIVLGLVPLVLIAWLLTAATLHPSRLALTAAALLAAGLPLFAAGISIGYSMSTKAALAVAQSLLLPLAFAGGLLLPPETFPGWLNSISMWLPTRAGRDLVVSATTGVALPGSTLLVLAAWTLITGSLAMGAYRRDEGRRFR